jgi:hypothetical protein
MIQKRQIEVRVNTPAHSSGDQSTVRVVKISLPAEPPFTSRDVENEFNRLQCRRFVE